MAGNPSAKKRQKEAARREHQKDKAERREQRKAEKGPRGDASGEDPDLAGIIPGPQPLPPSDDPA
ncbi:MAG: hypothetical protein IT375_21645 [Polyangiaceae bacterium]|jgi:hypothetical protein|nr:hypothetical protein [Polyangiaceae bacterium]MCK6533749.1 hypothetical protein [Polyangiaceae bacterium]